MTFIYDILVNLNENFYEFYEWKNNDHIINIRKIPLFKVSTETYNALKYNEITTTKPFLNSIYNQSSTYKNSNPIDYLCLISNGLEAIAIQFNNQGKLIKKSDLLFEEEDEVLEIINNLKITKIPFLQNINNSKINFTSRQELEKKQTIINTINYLYNNNETETLKYLYYDCFLEELNDTYTIRNNIINSLDYWNKHHQQLYKLISLLNINN
ncbi:MAG: DUF3603 family protein [bacterium]|nr:DUF3603 family protein [bacterium]